MLADAAATTAVVYAGRTAEDRRIRVDVRGGEVVRVRTTIGRYPCVTFGDVGPIAVQEAARARIGADGRFTLRAGEPAQRVTLTGVRRRRTATISGTVRLSGSIATGQKCASATLRYRASRN
jgi:hypothetical protein